MMNIDRNVDILWLSVCNSMNIFITLYVRYKTPSTNEMRWKSGCVLNHKCAQRIVYMCIGCFSFLCIV